MIRRPACFLLSLSALILCLSATSLRATPANKAALERHFGDFLGSGLRSCTTCHLPGHPKEPEDLEEIPHNPFGARLAAARNEFSERGLPERLQKIAAEDSDGDGAANELELLLGTNPGDAKELPSADRLKASKTVQRDFAEFLKSYRWEPFQQVQRPAPPKVASRRWGKNPIDLFIAAEHQKRGLKPRPEASKEVLLRRVYLDLVGVLPTPEEQRAFLADRSAKAYDKVVNRLLEDPRYGERWGRHWMDVWRYSDWAGWSGGNQIRDSQPHIWRWRDWIVESLNADKPYDRMVVEMLAADELAPTDTNTLRATGFLVRNYKMLSREQWLEDTVKHTAQAFLGVTVGCAKCHNHMHDPVSQFDYYQMRAVFEPHQVRTDKLPGQVDTSKDGLVRVYDVATNRPTYFLKRGDERFPDTNRIAAPAPPKGLAGKRLPSSLDIQEVALPHEVAYPDRRPFVLKDLVAASEKAIEAARAALDKDLAERRKNRIVELRELEFAQARAKHKALLAILEVEKLEDLAKKDSEGWRRAATNTVALQRTVASLDSKIAVFNAQTKVLDAEKVLKKAEEKPEDEAALKKARKTLEDLQKKVPEAEEALAKLEKEHSTELTTAYEPRKQDVYPAVSTGRRLAFAQWVAHPDNPLTARVAMNHIWLRRFGRGIVNTPADFGGNGLPPTHPALLDWLAAEFMARNWSMKEMHRLMVTSELFRMASTPDDSNLKTDPDNIYLWRMPSRRMEAEIVRDNLLWASGTLDTAMGGPEIPHTDGLTSRRRSIYLRLAAEKEVEFLKLFDGPSVNECYRRHSTVLPQQALAMANSSMAIAQAKALAAVVQETAETDDEFVELAFQRALGRLPTKEELRLCLDFLGKPGGGKSISPRENLALVLFNHNDFVTIR